MAETETKASQPETGNQRVQLGFGTLIIIALIVSMCSGKGEVDKIRSDTASLKVQLRVIDQKLDALVEKSGASTASVEESASPADAGVAPSQSP